MTSSIDVIREKMAGIEAREQAATLGEWRDEVTQEGALVVVLPCPYEGGAASEIYMGDMETTDKYDHADAAFIAHARTDIPLLLAALGVALETLGYTAEAGIYQPSPSIIANNAKSALERMAAIAASGQEG